MAIKQEYIDDLGLHDWPEEDLACFNVLDENGINVAEEDPEVAEG